MDKEQWQLLDKLVRDAYANGHEGEWVVVRSLEAYITDINKRLSKLESRSGLLSPSLSRQLWALFGRLVLLWIILGSVWLAVVLVALGLEGG